MGDGDSEHKNKGNHEHHKKRKNLLKNPWQVSTIALGIVTIILLMVVFGGRITGSIISSGEAGQRVLDFVNAQGVSANLVEVSNENNFYEVVLSMQGQKISLYVTKDGEFFTQALIPLKDTSTPKTSPSQTDIPKSDKPNVELFVMSYCPYGTQMEKGILPVVKELGDKIDFEVKFVNYAMHDKKEIDEQLRQYCIQRDYNDKYLAYLGKFLETENPNQALDAIGIGESDIANCVKETDETYKVTELYEDPQKSEWSGRFPPFKVYDTENKKYGVRGSPTLIINGQTANSGRDAQSLLNTICSTFNNPPEECNTDMTPFGNPAPGFGFSTQGGSATSAGCGA